MPVALAVLPRLKTFYVDEMHGNLANNPAVICAIIELVDRGRTGALPGRPRIPRSPPQHIDDAALSANDGPKIDWRRLDDIERAATLANLNQ